MDMEQKDPSGLFAAKVDRDNGLETSSSKDEGQILQVRESFQT